MSVLISCGDDTQQPEILVPTSPSVDSVAEGTTALVGVVLDIQNRAPIEGVLISTEPETERLLTNARGEFALTQGVVPNTLYTVVVEEPRYRTARREVLTLPDQISQVNTLLYPDGEASLLLPNPERLILTTQRRRAPVFLENLAGRSVSWFLADVSYTCDSSDDAGSSCSAFQEGVQCTSGDGSPNFYPGSETGWLDFSNIAAERLVFPGSPDILELTALRDRQGEGPLGSSDQAYLVLCDSDGRTIGIEVDAERFASKPLLYEVFENANGEKNIFEDGEATQGTFRGEFQVVYDGKGVEGEAVWCVLCAEEDGLSIETQVFSDADGIVRCLSETESFSDTVGVAASIDPSDLREENDNACDVQ